MMPFIIADRIKESSTTTGTGTFTLAGAVTGFRSFATIGNTNTTMYAIVAVDANGVPTGDWETGIGTYTSSGTTLSRGVIASSNSNSLVSFSAGTKHVMCCDVVGYGTPLVSPTTADRAIQVADQTANSSTSGNARGNAAVDLQGKRNNASYVASGGQSVISGGENNTASGARSTVSGGRANVASNSHAAVGGGYLNTASGQWGVVSGGYWNFATGDKSAVGGGYHNTASAVGACVPGGIDAKADKYGQQAAGAGKFAAVGDAQASSFVMRASTTNGTQTEMYLDGSSARLTIASDTTWAFHILLVARRTDADNESAAYLVTGCIDNNAGTTALVGSVAVTVIAEDSAAWDISVTANDTNDALSIKVTGESGKTIRWLANVRTCEVTG